jgi:3-oxoacyl-[acyl-carrier protein] reductase
MAGRLEGLTAVVTGAGGGHGRPIALALAEQGARVVVNDLGTDASGVGAGEPRAQQVADEINGLGGEAVADGGDTGDFAQAARLIGTAIDAWGKLDILVNVAGTIRYATISETTPDDWASQLHVHMTGYFNTSHHAAKHWVERGEYGRLINFSSDAGIFLSHPTLLAYSAAKAGVLGLTRACANALAVYNVTCNAIGPHGASTVMGDALPEAKRTLEQTGKRLSELSAGTDRDPVHCVPLIVYLASLQASHVSGRVFLTFGGRYQLLSEMHPEREINVNYLAEPERTYEEIEATLTAGLSLRDLTVPLARLDEIGPDWPERHGHRPPEWDFASAPAGAA